MMSQSMQQPSQQQGQPTGEQTATPKTAADVQAMLDNLDMRLMNGEIGEDLYNKLRTKWETRLEELK